MDNKDTPPATQTRPGQFREYKRLQRIQQPLGRDAATANPPYVPFPTPEAGAVQGQPNHFHYHAPSTPGAPSAPPHVVQPITNLHLDQRANHYRPWKEDLGLSAARTLGNFVTWPIRLIGRLIEAVINGLLGIATKALLIVLVPGLLIAGYNYAQTLHNKSTSQNAHDIGATSIHIVSGIAAGVWDAIRGKDKVSDTPIAEGHDNNRQALIPPAANTTPPASPHSHRHRHHN